MNEDILTRKALYKHLDFELVVSTKIKAEIGHVNGTLLKRKILIWKDFENIMK
ncbi:hypothetical protein FD11_GL001066 [Ligilactobacillus pobuzihii E100301 = KCTC 13174]|uniref:Uncharacterized protein n=1 Tax=Ligilactobacillus pobuzihii TaxID=449659 RepID=A0A0R2LHS4_9LACO|nr:hypothetical protein FD11_GL001066 [Ligilactobacillus pobuzihii E100301 = KCTC 13174]KRO01153.1 hypothetical protein IV66_GL001121 [Ligilactobacillus pobuzihii]